MDTGLTTTLIVLGVVVVVLVVVGISLWVSYNALTTLKVRVDEAWSDIAVQVERRADLIPTIVDTVKGYATHEKAVFTDVTAARAETLNAGDADAASTAEGHMQKALKSMFAVAEGVPAAAVEPGLPAAADRAGRHRGQDPGGAPVLQRRRP